MQPSITFRRLVKCPSRCRVQAREYPRNAVIDDNNWAVPNLNIASNCMAWPWPPSHNLHGRPPRRQNSPRSTASDYETDLHLLEISICRPPSRQKNPRRCDITVTHPTPHRGPSPLFPHRPPSTAEHYPHRNPRLANPQQLPLLHTHAREVQFLRKKKY